MYSHVPVLAHEVTEALKPRAGAVILDATIGGGGHAVRLLDAGARVIGLDVDPHAVAASRERLSRFGDRVSVIQGSYARARAILDAQGVDRLDGLVADLGASSPQFDDPTRGFSFSREGPLDMRMSLQGETAAELIARLDEGSLARLLFEFGEERESRRIARAIKRSEPPPTTTRALARLVGEAIPRKRWPRGLHPATRTFQALRIAVNRELEALDALLESLPSLMALGGRVAVISFHSLEDRRVKNAFRDLVGRCRCPPKLPVCVCNAGAGFGLVTRRAIVPTDAEMAENPRARSARLRVAERVR